MLKQNSFPRISIVIPTFNSARFIRETLESIKIQEYPNFEVIIIDGGSNDNTLSIINEYLFLNPILIQEKDYGLIHAVNKGVLAASGDYINWLNSDDFYFENALLKTGEYLSKNPLIDLLYGKTAHIDVNGKFLCWHNTIPYNKYILLNQACYIPCQSCFFKKSALSYIGLFDAKLLWAGDWDMWKRFAVEDSKFKIQFFDERIGNWRIHRDTISYGGGSKIYMKQNIEAYKSVKKYKTVPLTLMQLQLIPHILVGFLGLRIHLRNLRDFLRNLNKKLYVRKEP